MAIETYGSFLHIRQLREAFPAKARPPRYLLRYRDRVFGQDFVDQVKAMRIARSAFLTAISLAEAYVGRLIRSIRGECLDQNVLPRSKQVSSPRLAIPGSLRPRLLLSVHPPTSARTRHT